MAKTACPGPLVVDQPQVTTAGGLGNPSSVAVPASETPDGSVVDLSEPALTTGAAFTPGVPRYSMWSNGAALELPS